MTETTHTSDQLESSPGDLRVVASGLDTLWLFTRRVLAPSWAAALREARAEAESRADRRAVVDVGGVELLCRDHGVAGGRYLLESDLYALKVSPKPAGAAPTVTVEVRALALWAQGWRKAAATAVGLLSELCGHPAAKALDVQVSRVDLCLDLQGWEVRPEDIDLFRTRTRRSARGRHWGRDFGERGLASECRRVARLAAQLEAATSDAERKGLLAELHGEGSDAAAAYGDARAFSGFSFGRGAISARGYDKTRELGVSGKAWFRTVWGKSEGYRPALPVWRWEVQLRREALQELTPDGVTPLGTWASLKEHLQDCWKYFAKWLKHGRRRAEDRQAVSQAWAAVRDGFSAGGEPVAQLHRDCARARQAVLVPALAGYLTSAAAQASELLGGKGKTYSEALTAVLYAAHQYAEDKARPCEAIFTEKRSRLAARRRVVVGPRRAVAAAWSAAGGPPRAEAPTRHERDPESGAVVLREAFRDAHEALGRALAAFEENRAIERRWTEEETAAATLRTGGGTSFGARARARRDAAGLAEWEAELEAVRAKQRAGRG